MDEQAQLELDPLLDRQVAATSAILAGRKTHGRVVGGP